MLLTRNALSRGPFASSPARLLVWGRRPPKPWQLKATMFFLLDVPLRHYVRLFRRSRNMIRMPMQKASRMMETNYLGAFFLTNALLPLLKNSPVPSRIVNVTSFTHRCVSNSDINKVILARENFSVLSNSGKYRFAKKYEYSKFCTLLFSYELHRRLSATNSDPIISVMAADPGAVATNIMQELPSSLRKLAFVVLGFVQLLQSPESGVGSIIDAALAPPEVSGRFFFGAKGRTMKSSPVSYDAKLAEKLWLTSYELFEECKSRIVN